MNHKFTLLVIFSFSFFFSNSIKAQAVGDFQSTGSGNWGDIASWQTWNGTTWVAASAFPNSSDGVITILNGHTITNTVDVTVDQLVVAAGGTLDLYNYPLVTTITLDNGAGDDLIVNGTFLNRGFQTLASINNATVLINGIMSWTSGTLQAATTVAATGVVNLSLDFTKNLNSDLTNNGIINWASGPSLGGIFMNNSLFINNGTINENFSSNRGIADNGGVNQFVNNGIFNKTTTFTFANFNCPFTNNGTIQGIGTVSLTGTVDNTGIISVGPGVGPGTSTLAVSSNTVTGQTPSLNLSLRTAGAVAATNYDQLTFLDAGAVDLTNSTLNVTDVADDPPGTVYTIITSPGTITGPFASVNLPFSLGNITYNAGSVTVQKIFALPLVWGSFTTQIKNNTVVLNWSTLQENNTSHFLVEHSTDGQNFKAISTLPAKGNSSSTSNYNFTHTGANLNTVNYYRLLQVDKDGKSTSSVIRVVRFKNGQLVVTVLATPNPVRDVLFLQSQTNNVDVKLIDLNGQLVRSLRLQQGTQQVNVSGLPAGIYQLAVYQNKELISTLKIVKQ